MENVAFEAAAIEAYPSRAQWDAAAAGLVAAMLDRWHLTPGEAFVGGEAASVLRVTRRDGSPAVLKVGFPHVEAVGEAVALEAWGAQLSPRVLLQDPWTWSMLLEDVRPGIPLSRHPVPSAEALTIGAERYRALLGTAPPTGIPLLGEIVGGFLEHLDLPRYRAEFAHLGAARLVEQGLAEAADLVATDSGRSLLHGDFNPGNLLLDRSEGSDRWLVIDPKPMLGDAEFDLFPLMEQLGSPLSHPDPVQALRQHLELVVGTVGCDARRTARWCAARAALNVCWWVEDGNHHAAAEGVRELGAWLEISGA